MYRVIIVDDEKYVRKSIKSKIDWQSINCEVVCEAENGLEALEILDQVQADIMLIDIKMPKLGGLELIEQLRVKFPNLQVAIISGHDNFPYARQAMRLQVVDFIRKPVNANDLKDAILLMISHIETQKKKTDEMFDIADKVNNYNNKIHMQEINNLCENPEATISILSENPSDKFGWILLYFTPLSQSMKKIGNDQWKDIKDSIKNYFSESNLNCKYYISFNDLLKNEIRLLIPENEKSLFEVSNYVFLQLSTEYEDQFSAIHAATAETYSSIDKLYSLYNQTLRILKEKIFLVNSCLITNKMCLKSDSKKAELMFSILERLKELIKTHQFIKVESTLKKMLSNTSYLSVSSLESIILGIHSLAMEYSALYDIKMSEFFPYQLTGKYTLLTYSDLDQLYNTLESFIFSFFFESSQFEDDHIVIKVQKYINNNLSEKLGTSQIAKVFFFNPSYLSQLFKKHTKITLTKYIEKQRIEKACALLENFDLSITEIANEVGYTDANYFSKVFNKQMKKTPSEYKAKHE